MSLSPAAIKYQLLHAKDDRSHEGLVSAMVLASLATVAVALRLWARKIMGAKLKWDDYLIIAALIFGWGISCCIFPGLKYGLGKHVLVAGKKNVVHFLQLQLAFELIYDCAIPLVKFSILVFYSRIFPGQKTRWALYAIGAFVTAWWVTNMFAATLQCYPTNYLWDKTVKGGHCVNITALLVGLAATNMVTDIAILILPMHAVWHLQVPRMQKLAVMGIFLLGGFVCIASVVRLYYLDRVATEDPTWTAFDPANWSTIEVNLGIVSACLPIMRPLFRNAVNLRVSISVKNGVSSGKNSKFSNSYGSNTNGSYATASRNASLGGPNNGMVALAANTSNSNVIPSYSQGQQEYKATLDRDFDPGFRHGRRGSNEPQGVLPNGAAESQPSVGWPAYKGRKGSFNEQTGVTNEVTHGDAGGRGHGKAAIDDIDADEDHPRGHSRGNENTDLEKGLPIHGIKVKKAMEWSEEKRELP